MTTRVPRSIKAQPLASSFMLPVDPTYLLNLDGPLSCLLASEMDEMEERRRAERPPRARWVRRAHTALYNNYEKIWKFNKKVEKSVKYEK